MEQRRLGGQGLMVPEHYGRKAGSEVEPLLQAVPSSL
jgi:hypothetical protein